MIFNELPYDREVKFYLLSEYVISVLSLLMYNNTEREITIRASKVPPTAPSMIAMWVFLSGFFLVKIVTCGVSIDGLEETSLHDKVEKERHRFPDVLQNKLMHQHVKYHSKQEKQEHQCHTWLPNFLCSKIAGGYLVVYCFPGSWTVQERSFSI